MKLLIKERRNAPRISFYEDVWYKNINSDRGDETEFHHGNGKNISEFGICIRSRKKTNPGDIVELKFRFGGESICAISEVKWVRYLMHSEVFESGMEFRHISEENSEVFKRAIYDALYNETKNGLL
jgi:hypothetical protein